MDTCAIDITNLDFIAGDEIVIFETISQFNQFCKASQKTAYEVISNIGTRVVRNYVRY
jgi:alanine racemase